MEDSIPEDISILKCIKCGSADDLKPYPFSQITGFKTSFFVRRYIITLFSYELRKKEFLKDYNFNKYMEFDFQNIFSITVKEKLAYYELFL